MLWREETEDDEAPPPLLLLSPKLSRAFSISEILSITALYSCCMLACTVFSHCKVFIFSFNLPSLFFVTPSLLPLLLTASVISLFCRDTNICWALRLDSIADLNFVSFLVPLRISEADRSLGLAVSIDLASTASRLSKSISFSSSMVGSRVFSAAFRKSKAMSPATFIASPVNPIPNLSRPEAARVTLSSDSSDNIFVDFEAETVSFSASASRAKAVTSSFTCFGSKMVLLVDLSSFCSKSLSFSFSCWFSISRSSTADLPEVATFFLACVSATPLFGVCFAFCSLSVLSVSLASSAAVSKSVKRRFRPDSITLSVFLASFNSPSEPLPLLSSSSRRFTLSVCRSVLLAFMFNFASKSNNLQNRPRFFPLPALGDFMSDFLLRYLAVSSAVGFMSALAKNGWRSASFTLNRAFRLLLMLPNMPDLLPLSLSKADANSNPAPSSSSSI
mmetsp:Transcript_22479/g.31450  ORF Transcript_22479/g.31450 Transcript_22479/m.31450 type:complete len:447 (+) Transcript_22479:288-1628(+)